MALPPLILASSSPRRKDLLACLGLPFQAIPSAVEEEAVLNAGRPEQFARRLAAAKAQAVAGSHPSTIVLAADTVVVHRGSIFGKPRDAAEAKAMLRRLRGCHHRVVTAVAVLPPGRWRPFLDHVVTDVTMRPYSDEEIAASIARGDPFDKAGSYAIQDQLLRPVQHYDGCYCNVMGLPLWTTIRLLHQAGFPITDAAGQHLPPECTRCPLSPVAH